MGYNENLHKAHKSLIQCPNCFEKGIVANVSGLHSMTINGSKKLDNVGLCKNCGSIFKVRLVEMVESKKEGEQT